jgi:hypothetical protein
MSSVLDVEPLERLPRNEELRRTTVNNKQNETKGTDVEQEIALVNIEDLRTAFGGEDVSAPRETNQVNLPTTMCGGWE